MLAFHLLNHRILVDPAYGLDVLNHMWATEPVGTTSILLTSIGLLLTLSFKLMDFLWDVYKEQARQGRLKVELLGEQTSTGASSLCSVISNIGREPIVVRDIGYAKPRLIGTEFVRLQAQNSPLPHALNARELLRIHITEDEADLSKLAGQFRVKDSLGKLWEAPDGEIKKARRQLKVLKAAMAKMPAPSPDNQPLPNPRHALLEHLQSSAPISTQN
ncbi:hypothetical protein [Vampirovibrio sp.]|uniref:hypothetical protein n=1 Tax=Vampirovibrio sp. TaxID=2717857 RepID=UPI003593A97F